MKRYLTNAFSNNMLTKSETLAHVQVTEAAARNLMRNDLYESAIGHKDTAAVLSGILGLKIGANRIDVKLCGSWSLLVAQYSGPRLAEGATELPPGAAIEFWQVYPV